MTCSQETSESIAHWNQLALDQERMAEDGLVLPKIAADRAALYRRTARAIELHAQTGTPHCACCLKPMGAGIRI